MTNIAEDYVSFETAKLLKEKGFDVPTKYFFNTNGLCCQGENSYNWDDDKDVDDVCEDYSRPSIYVAMKWLRKEHEIFISPNTSFLYPIRYYCEIFCYGDNLKTQQDVTTENFESPEEACEAAIKYCLKNLI